MSFSVLILSAGASTRMGRPKALLEVDGTTFLGKITRTATAAGVGAVAVVIGPPDGDKVKAKLPPGVAAIWNPDPSRGMLSSVQAGLSSLPHRTVGVLVWPVDHPAVGEETVRQILSASPGRIVVPRSGGRGGHPVRIPRRLFGEIQALSGDASLRQFLDAHAADVVHLDVEDDAVVHDIDTPEEFARRIASLPALAENVNEAERQVGAPATPPANSSVAAENSITSKMAVIPEKSASPVSHALPEVAPALPPRGS